MATYVAMLRGVNVGGNALKMQRLCAVWQELGFQHVRTYVQSGNVVFEAPASPAKRAQEIETRLALEVRLPVTVLFRSRAEIQKVVAGNPLLSDANLDRSKLHVTFLARTPDTDAVERLGKIAAGPDALRVVGKEIYLFCPDGYGRSKLTNNILEKVLATRATTRNWNTVTRLYAMAVEE